MAPFLFLVAATSTEGLHGDTLSGTLYFQFLGLLHLLQLLQVNQSTASFEDGLRGNGHSGAALLRLHVQVIGNRFDIICRQDLNLIV